MYRDTTITIYYSSITPEIPRPRLLVSYCKHSIMFLHTYFILISEESNICISVIINNNLWFNTFNFNYA